MTFSHQTWPLFDRKLLISDWKLPFSYLKWSLITEDDHCAWLRPFCLQEETNPPFDRKWSYLKHLQMTFTVFLTKNDTFPTGSDTLSDQKWHPFQLEITPFLTGSDCAVVTAQAPSCRKQPRTYWSELSNTKYFCANKALFFIETHKVLAFSRNNLIHI